MGDFPTTRSDGGGDRDKEVGILFVDIEMGLLVQRIRENNVRFITKLFNFAHRYFQVR